MGRPFAEWAYVTPRFPLGITATDLGAAAEDIQRETALVWFLSNLSPYRTAGPWSYYDVPWGGPGRKFWAPAPVQAAPVLEREFGQVLRRESISDLVDALQGSWMWIERDVHVFRNDLQVALNQDEMISTVLARLDQIETALNALSPAHGGIGHNRPPEDLPISDKERAATHKAVSVIRDAARDGFREVAPPLKAALGWLSELAKRLGRYLLDRASDLCKGTVKSTAAAGGPAIVYEVQHHAWEIWHACGHVVELVERIF